MKAVTAATMQALDQALIAAGATAETLLARAGAGATAAVLAYVNRVLAPAHRQRFVVLAGPGLNGGDGYVIARLLAAQGLPVTLCALRPISALAEPVRVHASQVPPTVVCHTGPLLPEGLLAPGAVVVDCLLGTGATGAPRAPLDAWITAVNASGLPVVAIDLPSGLHPDTGEVPTVALRADLTVAIGLPKIGCFRGRGPELTGRLRVVDLGLPAAALAAAKGECTVVTHDDVRAWLPRLPFDTYKGTQGRVLVVGASLRYPGAAMLAAAAALRAGAGLVTLAYPAAMGALLRPHESALILAPVPDGGTGFHQPSGVSTLAALAEDQDVLVVGNGTGNRDDTNGFLRQVLGQPRPMVVDADALNVLAQNAFTRSRTATTVVTPHAGEMRRMLLAIGRTDLLHADRAEQGRVLAKQHALYVVCKGPQSIICTPDGRVAVSTSGSPALATGGTGDVLAGILGACLAAQPDVFAALQLGVFLHGLAAELAPRGMRHLVADDLLPLLGDAMCDISPFA